MLRKRVTDWLRLADVGAYYCRQTGDRVVMHETVRHWVTAGRRGYLGQLVRLKVRQRGVGKGSVYLTRKVWVDEFIRAVFGMQERHEGLPISGNDSAGYDDTVQDYTEFNGHAGP